MAFHNGLFMSEQQKKQQQFYEIEKSRKKIKEGLHERLFENNNINYEILFEHYDTLKYGYNCGYEWDYMEDNKLIQFLLQRFLLTDNYLFEEISNNLAGALQRSPQEIKERIIHHGKKAYNNENISIDKVCKVFGLQKSDIIEQQSSPMTVVHVEDETGKIFDRYH